MILFVFFLYLIGLICSALAFHSSIIIHYMPYYLIDYIVLCITLCPAPEVFVLHLIIKVHYITFLPINVLHSDSHLYDTILFILWLRLFTVMFGNLLDTSRRGMEGCSEGSLSQVLLIPLIAPTSKLRRYRQQGLLGEV